MFEADVVSATAAHPLATSVGKDKKGTIRQFLEDGREIVQYKSGEEVVVHDDGSMEQSNNFGERIEIDREGNRTEVVDGVVMVFNGTTNQLIRQENPDGSCIEFKDGEKTESFADGSTKVTRVDGSSIETNRDNTIEVKILADGTSIETDKLNKTEIITYTNKSKKQIEEDGTTIFEDMHGNVLQINPDGSRSATNKVDGTQTDVLEDGTVIVERNGRVIQKENDGTIMIETSGSETVLQVNEADADVGILAILEHAAEEVREDHFIPRAENEHAKETAEDSQKDGKGVSIGHDVYSLLSGFNRVFPDNVVRLRKAKVTTGTLMRRMEERKQEEERQIELRRDAARKAKERRKTELWEQQKLANSMTKIHKK
jgi:hypothetical protein